MTPDRTDLVILQLLFRRARAGIPVHVVAIAAALSARRSLVRCRLARLDQAGLVNARRCRLTLAGLALAVATPARARRLRLAA